MLSFFHICISQAASSRALSLALWPALSLLLISCGGGGDSQDPDPLSPDVSLAYVKKAVPIDPDNGMVISDDILDPDSFSIDGAGLFVRDRANQSSGERNVSDAAFAPGAIYDVKDLEVSFNGDKIVFAMRGPLDPNEDDDDLQPKWNLWEYDILTDTLSPIITDSITAGDEHDISPAYLPDGRIVFSSTRQVRSRAILLDDGKGGFAATRGNDEDIFNLHIIDPVNDPSGTNIIQISFNQGHELQPTVLSNGRIAFLREDNADGRGSLSIYTINSDGSGLSILYGYHSQRTGNTSNTLTTFVDVREQDDGTLSAILQHRNSATLGGDIIQINSDGFIDINQATSENSGDSSPGQRSMTAGDVNLDNNISTHGYFNSAYPLSDGSGSFIVSWNPCRLNDPATDTLLACSPENLADPTLEMAPPFFGLWGYDPISGTQIPIATPGDNEMFTDVVIMEPRLLPPVSAAASVNSDLATAGLAELHIESVYDTDGTDTSTGGINVLADPLQTLAAARPARFLRLIKAVSIPSDDVLDFDENVAFGFANNREMREILGYVPIEPDGSVKAQVPAEVAFYFDVVNVDGERISPLHRNWLHLMPGETFECRACHTANSELPHGRINAQDPSINFPGAFAVGTHFINTLFQNVSFTDGSTTVQVSDGDSMAEVYALANRTGAPTPSPGSRLPSAGLEYSDEWTDPAVRTPDTAYSVLYTGMATTTPESNTCVSPWQASCRIIINYPDHIQPLWLLSRPDGADNNQCTSCHSRTDDMGNTQQPSGQLELTNTANADEPLHFQSYVELFDGNNRPLILHPDGNSFLTLFVFDIVDGVQQFYLDNMGDQILDVNGDPIPEVRIFDPANDNNTDIRVQSFTGTVVDVYLDAMASPILDINGNPIEVIIAVDPDDLPPNGAVMNASNAEGSRFFDKLNGINLGSVINPIDHSGFMTDNELRLLREWLDIGGQYYNNPYDAPLN